MRRIYLLASCAAIAQVYPVPAWSQDEPSVRQDATIAEVIVTAQRREESMQKASVPISVVTSEQLTAAGVTQARDLSALVPGLQLSQGGSATAIYIRGVGDQGSTPITNPAVAFSVDGVYVARSSGVEGHFYDIQRVEVLKGPQGTLYGRNASGGAVNVITNKPNFQGFGGYVNLEVGNYEKFSGDAALNIPFSDQLAVRAAVQLSRRDGFVTDGWDDQDQKSGRLQLLWEPNDRLSVLLGGDYTHVGGVGGGEVAIPRLPGVSPWTSFTDPVVIAAFDQAAAVAGQCVPIAAFPSFALYPNQGACPPGFNQLSRGQGNNTKGTDNDVWGVHAEINYDLGFAKLTLIPAYRSTRVDWTIYPTFQYDARRDNSEQTSLEARLGNSDGNLKWVLGAYYFDETQSANFDVVSGSIQNSTADMDIKTRSYAAFGQATYSISESLRFVAGLRYTSDRREITAQTFTNNPGLGFAGLVAAGLCAPVAATCVQETLAGQKTFHKTNWRAGVEYDLSPVNMLYATAATGFKAGGFSANLAPTAIVTGPTDVGTPDSYRPETLTAYEVGSRNRFFDNRLQLNLEAFLWKYDDHQENHISIDVLGNVAQTYINAGKATQYGLNLDLIAKLTPADTLSANIEYLHSKYDVFAYNQPTVNPSTGAPIAIPGVTTGCSVTPVAGTANTSRLDCSGRQLNRAPTWSGHASYAHRFLLANDGAIEWRGSVNFVSARWLTVDFLPSLRDKARVTFDSSLTYQGRDGRFAARVFVRNITNEPVYSSGLTSPFVPGVAVATIGPPRTYGVGLTASF